MLFFKFFDRGKEAVYDIEVTTLADIKDIVFSSFIFKENDIFIKKEENPSEKVVPV